MHPRLLTVAALLGAVTGLSSPALRAAETGAAPASKGGFFSRSPKPAEKTPPAEPAPQNKDSKEKGKTSPAASPAPTPSRPAAGSETRSPKRSGSKKPLDTRNEDELFTAVRLRALEDPGVGELRAKADKARDKESGIAATKAYLRGLYGKMRDLEPGLRERIDLTETAAIQGLSRSQ